MVGVSATIQGSNWDAMPQPGGAAEMNIRFAELLRGELTF